MQKSLSLIALFGAGVATCLFAAIPASESEIDSRAGGKSQTAGDVHPGMVYATGATGKSVVATTRQHAPATAQRSMAAGLDLRGSVMHMSSWGEGETHYGVYTLPYAEGMTFKPVFSSPTAVCCGYDNGDGLFYGFVRVVEYGEYVYRIYHYDMETGEVVASLPVDQDMQASDIAIDPTTGKAYGCCPGPNSSFVWAELDYATGKRTDIAQLSMMLSGIGADEDGNFYAVGRNGKFYKLDKTNGRLTLVGETGLELQYLTGGCYNDRDNTFLMSFSTDEVSGLAEIDITTGESTVLNYFDPQDDITCLYIAGALAADKAPAKPQITASTTGGSQDVTVTVTMPSTYYDGTSAAGTQMGYTIYADGESVKEGTATAGSTVNTTVTVEGTGIHRFAAQCSNQAGNSPQGKTSLFVGYGMPTAPDNVKLLWNDGTGTLTWDAVTTCVDEGYINPQEVTYTVYDSKNKVVAENISGTTYSVSLPLKSSYYTATYSVVATNHGLASEKIKSNGVGIGSFEAPYTMEFKTIREFNQNTVYDANRNCFENPTWEWDGSNKRAQIRYHDPECADDWLFSPNIRLEGGYAYVVSAIVYEQSTRYTECISVSYGKNPTPEGMTEEVLEPTLINVNQDNPRELRMILKPTETGNYNIGFHGISDPDQDRLYIDSYKVEEKVSLAVPDVVTDCTVTADPLGFAKATVSCRLPEKTLAGNNISGRLTLDVYRGETKVKTLQGNPGETLSFEDNIGATGMYDYMFVATDASGRQGVKSYLSAFVGALPPANVTGRIGYNEGNMVHLLWNHVTTDAYGQQLPEGAISYYIYSINGDEAEQLNREPIRDNHYDFEITALQKQTTLPYAILPVNRDVVGETSTFAVAVGPAYAMPLTYDEAADGQAYNMTTKGAGRYPIGNKSNIIQPYSGEEYFVISFNSVEASCSYVTGKVAVTGDNPTLSFMSYRNTSADNNEVIVYVQCEGVEREVKHFYNSALKASEWNNLKVPLEEFKGKEIQVRIEGYCVADAVMNSYFDKIEFMNDRDYDVQATDITAPEYASNSVDFNIDVTLLNAAKNSGKFKVVLYRDGEAVDEKEVNDMKPYETRDVTFRQAITPAEGEQADYYAEAVYDKDVDRSNNKTYEVTVLRTQSTMPTVTGLTGKRTGPTDNLEWDAYDPDNMEVGEITEDFEDGVPFSHTLPGWTFVDLDGMPVGAFSNYTIPGIDTGSTTASFFVFDTAGGKFSSSFNAHSGTKYLASLYRADLGDVDDWLISPQLPGTEQTISFWAKSYDPSTPEKIQVYYSTEGKEVADFEMDEDFGTVMLTSYDWQQFTVTIPEGSRYFAIRSMADDSFMLMIDDITCTRLPVETGNLLGYNVYCGKTKVNAGTGNVNTFSTQNNGLDLTYYVTARFENGESELSAPVKLTGSGVIENFADGVKVTTAGRLIIIDGAAGKNVTVTRTDGIAIYRGTGDVALPVAEGVYIVNVNGKSVKLIVK